MKVPAGPRREPPRHRLLRRAPALALVAALAALPSVIGVDPGAPAIFHLGMGSGNLCGPDTLLADPAPPGGSCGQGFAVGVPGVVDMAPPHDYVAEGANRNVTVGTTGTAYLRFNEVGNPGVFDVLFTLSADGGMVLSGSGRCTFDQPCDLSMTGPGATTQFAKLTATMAFPTIVGAFTPSVNYGGPDPSRIETTGTWGEVLPANVTDAVPLPLADLPTGDLDLSIGDGSERCLGLSLGTLPRTGCLVGPPPFFGSVVPTDHWDAPRGWTLGTSATLSIELASYASTPMPRAGAADFTVTLTVAGRPSQWPMPCSWDALPATCTAELSGLSGHVPFKAPIFLTFEAAPEQPILLEAGHFVLHGTTWDPDNATAPSTTVATGARTSPGPGSPLAAASLLAVAAVAAATRRVR